ncbi:MAG: FkbM family methyltransferase [Anaerolineae bacterium]|nr:FkbM family methyltransferase [Anaerolineae bacterium]
MPALNPAPLVVVIAAVTRRLQTLSPQRPLRGLTRLGSWLPHYQGVIRLPDGVRLALDTRQPAERWLLVAGDYQPALTHILKTYTPPGGYCLDVGANLGFYALKFARWTGPAGRVLAFEANPALVDRIAQQAALNTFTQIEIDRRPIHVRAEPVTFYIAPNPGKSSIHARQVADPLDTLTLTATTLDAALAERGWPRLDVIKLDIEGNDCNALLGARESLARFRPVIAFEYWYSTPPDVAAAAFDLLASLGYRLTGLYRDGRRVPFEWQTEKDTKHDIKHIDVIAVVG